MFKIKTTNGTFTVKLKQSPRPGNFTVHIFLNKDKLPIFGTSFKQATPIDEITSWADIQINNYPKSINR